MEKGDTSIRPGMCQK